jgi:hypothetical protein
MTVLRHLYHITTTSIFRPQLLLTLNLSVHPVPSYYRDPDILLLEEFRGFPLSLQSFWKIDSIPT